MSTAIENQTTAKIIPLRRRTNPKIYVKAAAMLLAALLPMAAVYFFILKPQGNHSQAALTLQKERNNNEPPASIDTLRSLVKSREFDRADSLLPTALEAAQRAKNTALESELTYLQGRVLGGRGQFERAIAVLHEAIRLATAGNRPDLELPPRATLATIHHALDLNEEARDEAAKLVKLATALGNTLQQATGLQLLAISEFLVNRSPQAENMLQESVQLAKQQNNAYYVAAGLTYLGVIYTEQRQFQKAERYFREAILNGKKANNAQQQANALAIINGYYARSLAVARQLGKAADHYQQAIAFAQEAKVQEQLFLAQLHFGLGDCLQLTGKRQEAKQVVAKAKQLETIASQRCERNNTFLSVAVNRKPIICAR